MSPIPFLEETGSTTYLEDDLQHTGTRSGTRLGRGRGLLTLRRFRMVILAGVQAHKS